MIINTGARTDIPAFFSTWFINRIIAGSVCVRNPYFREQITRYLLEPTLVDCLVFCTKNPRPMLPSLNYLEKFTSYWFVTITPYGADVEPCVPPIDTVIEDFKKLSDLYGRHRVCWRYDPVFLNSKYDIEFHVEMFDYIAKKLSGYMDECIISFISLYDKTLRNFPGIKEVKVEEQKLLAKHFVRVGREFGFSIKTCAMGTELYEYGIESSGCISKDVLERATGLQIKDIRRVPHRPGCNCIPNRDIGVYNTCPHGCKYCYANESQEAVKTNRLLHDQNSPLLIGNLEQDDVIHNALQESYVDRQLYLF